LVAYGEVCRIYALDALEKKTIDRPGNTRNSGSKNREVEKGSIPSAERTRGTIIGKKARLGAL